MKPLSHRLTGAPIRARARHAVPRLAVIIAVALSLAACARTNRTGGATSSASSVCPTCPEIRSSSGQQGFFCRLRVRSNSAGADGDTVCFRTLERCQEGSTPQTRELLDDIVVTTTGCFEEPIAWCQYATSGADAGKPNWFCFATQRGCKERSRAVQAFPDGEDCAMFR